VIKISDIDDIAIAGAVIFGAYYLYKGTNKAAEKIAEIPEAITNSPVVEKMSNPISRRLADWYAEVSGMAQRERDILNGERVEQYIAQ
jgi:hypothetical protein